MRLSTACGAYRLEGRRRQNTLNQIWYSEVTLEFCKHPCSTWLRNITAYLTSFDLSPLTLSCWRRDAAQSRPFWRVLASYALCMIMDWSTEAL